MPPSRTFGGRSRFSSTSRLAKMPRSSGQNATPRRAIEFDGSRMVSLPSKRIEPVRFATMPMIDFSVVVLPAPLRPSSVTTSPSAISKSTPCRMCDSPYQALRPFTSSRLAIPRPQVGLDHARILGDGGVIALGEDLATLEHRDAIGERRDDGEVVLDHQDRPVRRHALDQRGDALDVHM